MAVPFPPANSFPDESCKEMAVSPETKATLSKLTPALTDCEAVAFPPVVKIKLAALEPSGMRTAAYMLSSVQAMLSGTPSPLGSVAGFIVAGCGRYHQNTVSCLIVGAVPVLNQEL